MKRLAKNGRKNTGTENKINKNDKFHFRFLILSRTEPNIQTICQI